MATGDSWGNIARDLWLAEDEAGEALDKNFLKLFFSSYILIVHVVLINIVVAVMPCTLPPVLLPSSFLRLFPTLTQRPSSTLISLSLYPSPQGACALAASRHLPALTPAPSSISSWYILKVPVVS